MFMYSCLEILVHLANSFWCHILLWFQYGLIHVLLLFWIHFAWVMCYHLIPAVQQYFPWLWRVWIAVTEQLCLGLMAWILLCLLELEENSVWQPLIMRRCPVVVVLACEGLPVSLSAHPFLIMLQDASQMTEAQWCACASELGFQLLRYWEAQKALCTNPGQRVQQGFGGLDKRKGSSTCQGNMMMIRQLLRSWILYWRKVCHKSTKQASPVTFLLCDVLLGYRSNIFTQTRNVVISRLVGLMCF